LGDCPRGLEDLCMMVCYGFHWSLVDEIAAKELFHDI
jgi:hypothetical protein